MALLDLPFDRLRACPVLDTGANGKGKNPFVLSLSKHESAINPIYAIDSRWSAQNGPYVAGSAQTTAKVPWLLQRSGAEVLRVDKANAVA